MGMYDSVMVECPKCGTENEFQSKSGDCCLYVYNLNNCPDDVLQDVNRHSPVICFKCQTPYKVDVEAKKTFSVKDGELISLLQYVRHFYNNNHVDSWTRNGDGKIFYDPEDIIENWRIFSKYKF